MFKNVKIWIKLTTLVAVLALGSISVGLIGISNTSTVNDMLNDLYDNRLVPILDISNANMQAIYQNKTLYDYIIQEDKNKMDAAKVLMDKHEKEMMSLLDTYKKTSLVEKEKELIAKFERAWPEYIGVSRKIMAFSYEGKNTEAMNLMNGEGSRLFQAADSLLTDLANVNKDEAKKSYDESDVIYDRGRNMSLGILASSLAIGIFLAVMIIRSITGPLNKTVAHTGVMAGGDFYSKLDINQQDEVGQVAKSMNAMATQLSATLKEILSGVQRLIASTLRQYGIMALFTTPENLSVDVINKYLEIKDRQ